MDATGPNAEQITYWNEHSGPKWVARQALLDAQLASFGEAAIEAARVQAGERVLDVGCGCGDTTLAVARRVGAGGRAVGVDLSAPMLARARERAAAERLANAEFLQADAQTHPLAPASFDAVVSRFGVMFFADPTAAFRNLRTALVPGGRLAFACWQSLPENPWMLVPVMAAAQHVPLPPPPAPGAPGPFSFAERARVEGILSGAGFADVEFRTFAPEMTLGGEVGLDGAVEFLIQLGPMAAALREANRPELLPAVTAAVREALAPYVTPRGVVMASKAWIVTGRRAD
jgi:SAM-dependent methyltransferase